METRLFAQIFTPTTLEGGKRAIGTAYPIAKDLVLTARHVLFPDSRDESKPREVVWLDCKDATGQAFTSEITSIVFDGGMEFDIAVITCNTPPEANTSISLSARDPLANEGWDSFGYPKAGKDEAKGIREKIPGKGTFFQPDANSHSLHLTSEGDASTKKLWQGMSGAPVFSRNNPRQLLAVITSTPENLEERLYAVSIPYLLRNNQDFKKAVGYSDVQTVTSLLPPVMQGDEFKKFLHKQISLELQRPEARCFKEQLASLFEHDKTAPDLVTLITHSLLEHPVDEAIREFLTLAASDCICPTGCRYPEVSDKVDLVRQVAEQILGWLVLSSINEKEIQQLLPYCKQHDSLFFKLGVDSFAGVEIVLSRRFGRNTAWPNKDSADPKSRYLIPPHDSWFKWDDQETVRKILIEIWNTVFRALDAQKGADDKLNETEVKKLDATLRSRRIKPRNTEHYYIAFKLPEGSSAFAENIYQQLLSSLQQMTVVQFGVECLDSLFLLPEAQITTELNEFYREINGLAGQ